MREGHGKHITTDALATIPESQKFAEGSELLIRAERKQRIIGLRRRGLTYEQIRDTLARGADGGEPVGLALATVASLVRRYLREVEQTASESVEELRVLENERLDELIASLGPAARSGDTQAANTMLRAMERRAKLNGLDAAHRVEHSFNADMLRELGTDPEELRRQREAFATAYGSGVIDGTVVEDGPDAATADHEPAPAVQDDRPGEADRRDEPLDGDGMRRADP